MFIILFLEFEIVILIASAGVNLCALAPLRCMGWSRALVTSEDTEAAVLLLFDMSGKASSDKEPHRAFSILVEVFLTSNFSRRALC